MSVIVNVAIGSFDDAAVVAGKAGAPVGNR